MANQKQNSDRQHNEEFTKRSNVTEDLNQDVQEPARIRNAETPSVNSTNNAPQKQRHEGSTQGTLPYQNEQTNESSKFPEDPFEERTK